MKPLALSLCLTLAALLPVLPAHTEEPARPNLVPGLALPAPQKVTAQVGYLKVQAQCEGLVIWDVSDEWDAGDDEAADVDFHWDYFTADKKTIIVAVPNLKGAITIRAAGHAKDGTPIEKMAVTVIEVEPKAAGRKVKPSPPSPAPTPPPAPAPPAPLPAPPAPPRPAAGPVHLFLIIDHDKVEPQVVKAAEGKELADQVKATGDHLHILSATSKTVADQGLTALVKEAGGAPALVILTQDGDVLAVGKVPASSAEIMTILQKAKAGGP